MLLFFSKTASYDHILINHSHSFYDTTGKPTYFITITCNPHWAEIERRMLHRRQTAYDRSEVTAQVFNEKLHHVIEWITHGGLEQNMSRSHSQPTKTVFLMYVIEFQKRGLPHAHIAIKVNPEPQTPDEIDAVVTAEYPEQDNTWTIAQNAALSAVFKSAVDAATSNRRNWMSVDFLAGKYFAYSSSNPVSLTDLREAAELPDTPSSASSLSKWWNTHLHQHVINTTGLVHKSCSNCRTADGGRCKRGYPFPVTCTTTIDRRGYVQYRRRNQQSHLIVPHNFLLSLVAGCHVNVEIAHTVNIIDYLYKYIYKGSDHVYIKFSAESKAKMQNDEITAYEFNRYISSCEAAWRIMGYGTNGNRHPAVGKLSIHRHGYDSVALNYHMHQLDQHDADDNTKAELYKALKAPDDPTRNCTAEEQYLLRPRYVLVDIAPSTASADKTLLNWKELYTDGTPVVCKYRPDGTTKHKCEYVQVTPDAELYPGFPCVTMCKIDTSAMTYIQYHDMFMVARSVHRNHAPYWSQDYTYAQSYVHARTKPKLHRMRVLYPRSGEDYYLRMVLAHCPSPTLHSLQRAEPQGLKLKTA
jgi:hypothetical protein